MIPAPIPDNDAERVASLEKMNLLSTGRERDLDRVTRVAQKYFQVEIALVSLIDKDRQWFKARCGLDASETSRDISFCGHAIHGDSALVVEDALQDERFFDNPLVTDGPEIRFYAGQPLVNRDGFRIGTLCMISPKSRCFSDADRNVLEDFGRLVELVLENRTLSETQSALLASLAAAERDKLIDPLTGLWNRRGLAELFEREISRAARLREPLVIGMVDIDHFKKVNDRFGHPVGDAGIKLVAELLVRWARSTDIVARFGGEEFVFVAPNVVPLMIPILGDKLLRSVRANAKLTTADGPHALTVSVGFMAATPKKYSKEYSNYLIESADQALYTAKEGGRDRYEVLGVPDSVYADIALA